MKILILLSWFAILGFAQAEDFSTSFGKTPQEEKMCQERIYARMPLNAKGNDWAHMHHYCDCLRFYDRARSAETKRDTEAFKFDILSSESNCQYVLNRVSKNWTMRPEVLVMRGRSLELGGRVAEALLSYNEAVKTDPNFSMAYAALGNFFEKNGNKADARKMFEEGLRRHPDNKYLRTRFNSLQGNK